MTNSSRKSTIKLSTKVNWLFALAATLYLPVLAKDAMTYRSVVTGHFVCCGFVSESWFERPVTYALVDDWTTPMWKENAIKTERWLTSDGMVNGETKFWRLLERQSMASAPQ